MPEQNPQRYSELATFGEELRREREIRGISLKEIADATKISRRFLEAIERNDHKTLPAPVFTRGFVREYARYLGLNTEEMVNRYNYAALGDDRIEQSAHLEHLVHPQPEPPEPKKIGLPPPYKRAIGPVILTLLTIAGLAAVTWWAVTTKRMRDAAPRREPVVTAPATVATPPPPAPRAGEGAGATLSTAAPVDDKRLHLTMQVTDDAWVTLEVDGETVINDELRAGTTRTFEADKEFRFRSIGNAAGMTLTLNGTPLPALGSDGQVLRNRVFDRAYLERLRATEAAPR